MLCSNLFFFIVISEIIYIIIDILILPFSIWTTTALKVLYCIYMSYNIIRFTLFIIILIIAILNKCQKLFDILVIIFFIINFIFIFFFIFQLIIITINYRKTEKYWKNCPYIINDLKYDLHIKRRCELYNININSRYSYQYICSYDSSKEFKSKLSIEILPDKVVCSPFKNLIDNNDIVKSFENEYKNEKKFYCSRTDLPEDYSFAKHKNCNEKQKKYMIAFLILSYLRIMVFVIYIICLIFLFIFGNNQTIRIRNRFPNISRKSTIESDSPKKNDDFKMQKTINIIIENKKEYIIKTNIQTLKQNNQTNKINNNILTMRENINEIKSITNLNDL